MSYIKIEVEEYRRVSVHIAEETMVFGDEPEVEEDMQEGLDNQGACYKRVIWYKGKSYTTTKDLLAAIAEEGKGGSA